MCVPEVEAPVMTSVKVVPDDASFAAGKLVFSLSVLIFPLTVGILWCLLLVL